MATLKTVVYFAILIICILHARSEKVNVVKETTTTPQVVSSQPVASSPIAIDSATEDLVRMCANRDIKRCNDRKCNQMICPKGTKGDYGCLPKGNSFFQYKTDVCNGVYKAAPKPKIITPEPTGQFSFFYFFAGVLLVAASGVFIYSKLTTQQISMFNMFTENDLESKRKEKLTKYNEFSDLDETNTSFISRRTNYRSPMFSALLE